MEILFASDLHGNEKVYEKLFDLIKKRAITKVILGGDLCPHLRTTLQAGINAQKHFLDWLVKKIDTSNAEFFAMLGNDDFRINAPILERAGEKGTLQYLHKKSHRLGNFNIVGYSFVSQMPFLLKDWEKPDIKDSIPLTNPSMDVRTIEKENGTIEEDLIELKKLSDPKKTIYVMHAPPFRSSLDTISGNRHVGSKSIRKFIEQEQPPLTLHGHIHESYELSGKYIERIGKTICINPGSSHISSNLNCAIFELENLNNMGHYII